MWRSSEFHQVGTRKGMQRERDSQKYRLTPRHGWCHLRCVAGSEMGSGPSDSSVKWGTPTKVASATSWGSARLVGLGAPIKGKPPYLLEQSRCPVQWACEAGKPHGGFRGADGPECRRGAAASAQVRGRQRGCGMEQYGSGHREAFSVYRDAFSDRWWWRVTKMTQVNN